MLVTWKCLNRLPQAQFDPTTPENVALRDSKSMYFYDRNGRNLENFSRYLEKGFVIFRRFF